MKRDLKKQFGAVYVETAITIFFYISIVASILMFSIAVFWYSILVDTTDEALKTVAIDASSAYGTNQCAALSGAIETAATSYLQKTYGISNPADRGITFEGTWNFLPFGVGNEPGCRVSIGLTSSWNFNCFFCPRLKIPSALTVAHTRIVEDSIFRNCWCSTCT